MKHRATSMLLIAGMALLGLLPVHGVRAQNTVVIEETGPRTERLNIVMLSEGYTSSELSAGKFTTDAQDIADALLTTEPFKSYRPYFNVYGIAIASAQSGADSGSAGTTVNTYFNATFNSFGIDRLLTIDSTGTNRVYALLNQFVPEYDIVLVVVNDSKYGGSGGAIAVTSTNASAPEIAIHEIGHSFGGLGDEYDYPGGIPLETPNTTKQTVRSAIKWNAWISAATPVPTPETSTYGAGLPGLFEGAAYRETGWYRPTLDSKMQSLGVPFYAVNEEALVLSIYRRVSTITSTTPAAGPVTINTPDAPLSFSVNGPSKASHAPAVTVEWTLNGQTIPAVTGRTLALSSSVLGNGTHTLVAKAKDPTLKVRNDPTLLLQDQRSWTLNVSNQGPAAPSNLAVTMAAGGDVSLNWSDNSPDEGGFAIERSASGTAAFVEVGRVLADITSFTDSTNPPVKGSRYRITSINAAAPQAPGKPSNIVTLTAPAVTAHPAGAVVIYGMPVRLAIATTGTPTLLYQWRRNQTPVPGATGAALDLPSVQSAEAGVYDCVVTSALGSATSKTATLTVYGPPYAESLVAPTSVPRGGSVAFSLIARGLPAPTLQWRRNGVAIAGATTTKLTLASAKDSDAGDYDCLLTNSYGSTTVAMSHLDVLMGVAASNANHRLFGQRAGLARWQWVQRIGGTQADSVSALALAEGKLFAGGFSNSTNARFGTLSGNALGGWTGRFHPLTGAAEWVKQASASQMDALGNMYGVDSLRGNDAGRIIAGAMGNSSTRLVRQSAASGAIDWAQPVGSTNSRINAIDVAADGSIYAIEVNASSSHLIKTAADGTTIWQRATNGYLTGILVDAAGRIFISGRGTSTPPGTSFENASPTPPTLVSDPVDQKTGFIVCYDADGNVQWSQLKGRTVVSVAAGADSGHLCAAVNEGGENDPKATLIMIDSTSGAITQSFSAGDALPAAAVTTPGGELALLLNCTTPGTAFGDFVMESAGFLVAKYSATGSLQWLLPVYGTSDANILGQRSRLVVNPADGRLYVGFSVYDIESIRFPDRLTFTMTGRGVDGFLACISETPAVVTPPQAQIVPLGGTLHLSVDAGALAGTVSYQWLKDGKVLAGRTLATFDLAAAKLTDAGSYSVRITGSGGTTESAKAVVNVIDTASRSLSAPASKVLDLPVTAAGTGLSYTWWKNGTRIFNSGGFLNSTTSRLRISAMSPAFADNYVCKVTGPGGTVQVPFTTTVMQIPVFAAPTLPGAVVSGWFELQLSASEAASYSVKNLPSGLVYNARTGLISGIPNAPSSGVITVTATNAAGSSNPALTFTLTVSDLAAQARGGFQALVERQPWNAGLGGVLVCNVSSNGSMTGSLLLAGQKFTLLGRVNASATTRGWTFQQRLLRTSKPALVLNLISPPAMDGALTGTIIQEAPATAESAAINGRQTVWSSSRTAAAFAGTYTATLTPPPGSGSTGVPQGVGSLKTVINAATGLASWSGKFADNTGFSGSSKLWPDGSLPHWVALYGNLGSLMGAPVFSTGLETGPLEWTRNLKAGAPSWPATPLTVNGLKQP